MSSFRTFADLLRIISSVLEQNPQPGQAECAYAESSILHLWSAIEPQRQKQLVGCLLKILPTDEDRVEVFSHFCRWCGLVKKRGEPCYCQNDE